MSAPLTAWPWKAATMIADRDFMASLATDNMHIVRQGVDVLAMVWAPDGHEDEDLARMIAAMPDLLAAAKLADDVLENAGFSPTDPDVLRIRAAIAKAEGRS